MSKGMTVEGWDALRAEVYGSFSPGSPIKLQGDLAGREEQASRLRGIALSSGEHALIYGERGAGKTSIANTFHLSLNSPTRTVEFIHVNCGDNDFTSIWRKIFRRIKVHDDEQRRSLDQFYPGEITPDDVEVELANFGMNVLPIIVLDEFDQVRDDATKAMMAETIKSFSDHTLSAKIILVGIASNASELITHHGSISRALKQVQMPRLSLTDLEAIVHTRYKKCLLRCEDAALFQMAFLSRGLPYYTHLIGRHAALAAIDKRQMIVKEDDVFSGLREAIKEVDQTITEAYLTAVVSQRPEETLYEPVLIASALADADELGQFQQAAVGAPLSEIAPRTPPYGPTTYAFHMNEFCESKRGKILSKTGEARTFRYHFADAMMQPYVIIRALQNGKLKRDTFHKFTARRQRSLSI